ncbi:MAG TPA: alpha/beta hydrolase [Anaerolineales bacterium]|nr:alpha/beta hydrolase [Anaerolineales bacterium]
MSTLVTDQGMLHFEVFGRGQPVILLHGWLGSWGVWQETMAYLSRSYRTYALDFWGFGESGKKRTSYAMQDFVQLVDQFMEYLGIDQAPLVGHSMGGTVGLMVALQNPHRTNKVVVIGSPIEGTSLAFPLKMAGIRPVARLVYNAMWALKLGIRAAAPLISRDRRWPAMFNDDISRTTLMSFMESIRSLRQTDLRSFLSQINLPVMGMYGDRDIIVKPDQWQHLAAKVPYVRIERFRQAGHFIMLDETQRFIISLSDFLASKVYPKRDLVEFPITTSTTLSMSA